MKRRTGENTDELTTGSYDAEYFFWLQIQGEFQMQKNKLHREQTTTKSHSGAVA